MSYYRKKKCLTPHTNQRVVTAASVWQVRQPVYKRSVECWRYYEKYLAPLGDLSLPA